MPVPHQPLAAIIGEVFGMADEQGGIVDGGQDRYRIRLRM
jgi:hypothetical protein